MFDSVLYESFPTANGLPFDLNWGMLFLCMTVSLVIGIVLATVYRFSNKNVGRSFMTALILVPPALTVIVPLCNSNLGIGLAMAGVFSLVRFRSYPGQGRDIAMMFVSVVAGILCGAGFIAVGAIMGLLSALVVFVMGRVRNDDADAERDREVRICIPESLNYTEVFDDIFEEYTEEAKLFRVKTTNMGAMYELRYLVRLKETSREKEFIDAIRTRNGNLSVLCAVALAQEAERL